MGKCLGPRRLQICPSTFSRHLKLKAAPLRHAGTDQMRRVRPVSACPERPPLRQAGQNGTAGKPASITNPNDQRSPGGRKCPKLAIFRRNGDPPRTRQVRDTYETGTSQVRA